MHTVLFDSEMIVLSIGKCMISQYTILGSYRQSFWYLNIGILPHFIKISSKSTEGSNFKKKKEKKIGTALEENTVNIYIIAK